jgi:GAF domain-containing protein
LKRQLKDAAQQDKATSEVLRIISGSTGDPQPVFATILANAVQVCDANNGVINRWDGNALHLIAAHRMPPEFTDLRTRTPYRPNEHSPSGRMLATGTFVHIRDLAKDQSYARRNPPTVAAVEIAGVRTTLAVPMFKDKEFIGSFTVGRTEVRPFTVKQIELVQNFAAKAAIAIENARLVQELQESLEQQTAVADVLQAITGSPGNLQPVFDTVLENARRLCDAEFGNIYRWDGDALHLLAWRNTPPAFAEYRKRAPFRPSPRTLIGRMLKTKSVVHVANAATNQDYSDRTDPSLVAAIELGGVRTCVAVPMLKEGELVGAITLFRQEVRPFTERQIALITNFANEVSIAIENARLVHELRESLEQQAAAADVLNIISRSTFDLQTVLDRLVELVTKLCDADLAAIHRQEGMNYRVIAICGGPPDYREIQNSVPLEPGRGTVIGRAVLERKPVHVADVLADSDYLLKDAQRRIGYRTVLGVPLMREGRPIGVIALLRLTVRPFTEKQIKLVQSFADQAVIAIENTRLLDDLTKLNHQLEHRVADQVGEIERTSRLRRFLPPQVADLIVASGTEKQLESHRREITALFCDLRGFTGFSESSDPEDVMTLLCDYHAAIGQIIIKYGGTLERFAGDGVMVIFNDPVPIANPALQAVLMALDMRTAIGGMIEKWRDLGHDLGFGIGIAHGFATLGTIGFEGRFDYAAIGTVSNVASRLCDEAKPGQILISPRVRQAVDKAVTIEPVGEFMLKGIRRPVMTHNVLESKPS